MDSNSLSHTKWRGIPEFEKMIDTEDEVAYNKND